MTMIIFLLMLLCTFIFVGAVGFAVLNRLAALEREVSALKRNANTTPAALQSPPIPHWNTEIANDELLDLICSGQKIQAIKLYREINRGVGLKEAKDAVEAMEIRVR